MCKVWFILAEWFRKEEFQYSQWSFAISPLSLLRPFSWKNLNSLHPILFCAKVDWNGLMVLWKKTKMWTVYKRTDGRLKQGNRKAFSSVELKPQRNIILYIYYVYKCNTYKSYLYNIFWKLLKSHICLEIVHLYRATLVK